MGAQTHNGELQSLKELVTVLSEDQCDETLRLTGLKVLRAILYLQPNGMVTSPKSLDDEYKRHLDNLPPSSVGEYEFSLLQSKMAKLGCVSVVIKCIESQNQEIVMASLQLAVTLLEGGNTVVQQLFATILTTPISGPFFLQLKALFVDSSEAIKAEKRKIKFAHAEKIVLQKAGICHIEHGEVGLSNLTKGRAQMFETIKFLRGMCTVQFTPLQNLLREQRLNHETFDFISLVVQYLVQLEPELQQAFYRGDYSLVQNGIGAFRMLSDTMHGPNRDNQGCVADTGMFDLCDRVLARITSETPDSELGVGKANLFGSDNSREALVDRNTLRSTLKLAITQCLAVMVEGRDDNKIPKQVIYINLCI